MERIYNKLVRDKIPDIIMKNGEVAITRVLYDDEYKTGLEKKLFEECNEVVNASGVDRIEELADVLEIIISLAKVENKKLEDVIMTANKKNEKRGSFNDKIFLEKVIETKK